MRIVKANKHLLLLLFGLLPLGPGRARPPALGTCVGPHGAVRTRAAAAALVLVLRLVAASSFGLEHLDRVGRPWLVLLRARAHVGLRLA